MLFLWGSPCKYSVQSTTGGLLPLFLTQFRLKCLDMFDTECTGTLSARHGSRTGRKLRWLWWADMWTIAEELEIARHFSPFLTFAKKNLGKLKIWKFCFITKARSPPHKSSVAFFGLLGGWYWLLLIVAHSHVIELKNSGCRKAVHILLVWSPWTASARPDWRKSWSTLDEPGNAFWKVPMRWYNLYKAPFSL